MRAFSLIERFPQAWHPLTADIRRCRFRRFPYSVVYASVGADLVVLAIAHHHRKPAYWRNRLKPQT